MQTGRPSCCCTTPMQSTLQRCASGGCQRARRPAPAAAGGTAAAPADDWASKPARTAAGRRRGPQKFRSRAAHARVPRGHTHAHTRRWRSCQGTAERCSHVTPAAMAAAAAFNKGYLVYLHARMGATQAIKCACLQCSRATGVRHTRCCACNTHAHAVAGADIREARTLVRPLPKVARAHTAASGERTPAHTRGCRPRSCYARDQHERVCALQENH